MKGDQAEDLARVARRNAAKAACTKRWRHARSPEEKKKNRQRIAEKRRLKKAAVDLDALMVQISEDLRCAVTPEGGQSIGPTTDIRANARASMRSVRHKQRVATAATLLVDLISTVGFHRFPATDHGRRQASDALAIARACPHSKGTDKAIGGERVMRAVGSKGPLLEHLHASIQGVRHVLDAAGIEVTAPTELISRNPARQKAHRDAFLRQLEKQRTPSSGIPISMLESLQDGGKLPLWPESMYYKEVESSNVVDVPLEQGDILVFHSLLVHYGAAYKEEHRRIFWYGRTRVGERGSRRYTDEPPLDTMELVDEWKKVLADPETSNIRWRMVREHAED